MSESIRALLYILLLSVPAFYVGQLIAVPLVSRKEFSVWRNSWYAGTVAAFLSGDFFIFAAALIAICWYASARTSRLSLYIILLFTAPPAAISLGGFGIVNYLLLLNHAHVLTLLLLVPALLSGHGRTGGMPVSAAHPSAVGSAPVSQRSRRTRLRKLCDVLILAFVFLQVVLQYREAGTTHVIRMAVIHTLTIALPYFAFSRSLRNLDEVRTILLAFVVAVLPLALVGVFEVAKSWLLYPPVAASWGVPLTHAYIVREGSLRAAASAEGPIAFGYLVMVAIGCMIAVRGELLKTLKGRTALAILAAGLAASLSRGPWVGTVVLILVLVMVSPRKAANSLKLLGALVLMAPVLLTPAGERIIRLLPFVGSVDVENIDYRHRLLENSLLVIERNLLFGSGDYLATPEMQEMIQGQGIIDVVNTFVQVALESGIVGLALFVLFFAGVLLGLAGLLKQDAGPNLNLRAVLATLVAILVTITTVSSVSFIPYVYWMMAGLSVGLLRIAQVRRPLADPKAIPLRPTRNLRIGRPIRPKGSAQPTSPAGTYASNDAPWRPS